MVSFAHDGLQLWYATADAPAPEGTTEAREGVSVTLGVRPARPENAVRIRYRVDDTPPQTISATLINTDFGTGTQYFRATFPRFWSGQQVDYLPILSNAGRRAPDPATATAFASSFRLADPVTPGLPAHVEHPETPTFPARVEYLASARVSLDPRPQLVGETPAGVIITWPPSGGTVNGSGLRGVVCAAGEHDLTVREDGVGILQVRAFIQTDDGALISTWYSGIVDLGADGAARAREQRWPAAAAVRAAPQLLTSHPRYQWLNRLQCIGVGEVRPSELLYTYDLYALR
jgi:hypothetical protein